MLAAGVRPGEDHWAGGEMEFDMFAGHRASAEVAPPDGPPTHSAQPHPRVPRAFMDLARIVFLHRSPTRKHLLYAALWRIVEGGERNLLAKETDPGVHPLLNMRHQVLRDVHKMKAFVRFRCVERDGVQWYVAWYQPDHRIVRRAVPFFQDRFRSMNWSILTPDESVHWDQKRISYSGGVSRDPLPGDVVEELWRTYYAKIFNPSRLNVKVMESHMPRRRWATLPEARLIPALVEGAERENSAAASKTAPAPSNAEAFIPCGASTLEALNQAAQHCRACPLYNENHHAVGAEGPIDAALVLVGEQPGDEEDRAGRPFIGPSGKMLNRALAEVGLDRSRLCITEAVKHFNHQTEQARRLHRTPTAAHIAACRPWLVAEMKLLQPKVLLCLGTTAAHSVLGRRVRLKEMLGKTLETPFSPRTIVTYHPAAILRQTTPVEAHRAYNDLKNDLLRAALLAELL